MVAQLDGISVVALEQAVAVPFATRQLADLGARVIKIERREGGDFARAYDTTVRGLSSHFVWLNRGKESLTLDIKRPEAQEILTRLIDRADIFVQNLGPGAAERLGLGSQVLRARHPRLITCRVTGYGSQGPYAGKKAYDLLVQSEAGLLSITGTEETPSKVGLSIADIAGGMYTYSGILAALFQRERTGQGVAVETSLFEALGEWMGYAMYYTMGGSPPPRTGARHATIAPYGSYPTKDGQIILGVHSNREWTAFCTTVLGRPELAEDPRFQSNRRRVENRAEMDLEIERVFRLLPAVEVSSRLDQAGIANAHLNSVPEFINHPQLTSLSSWRDVESPVGLLPALLPPVHFEGSEPVLGRIPALGEHTQSILEELGFDASTISRWKDNGVI